MDFVSIESIINYEFDLETYKKMQLLLKESTLLKQIETETKLRQTMSSFNRKSTKLGSNGLNQESKSEFRLTGMTSWSQKKFRTTQSSITKEVTAVPIQKVKHIDLISLIIEKYQRVQIFEQANGIKLDSKKNNYLTIKAYQYQYLTVKCEKEKTPFTLSKPMSLN